MPYGKLIDFEYVNKIEKKKLATIISIVALGLVSVVICGIVLFSHREANENVDKIYKVFPSTVNWFKAHRICHLHGMKLISIESSQDQDRIVKAIKEAGLEAGDFWTTGTRTGNNETFYWMENGNDLTFTNWAAGEPNKHPFFQEPEECIQLRSSAGMKWNDVACEYNYNVVCERK